MARIVDVSRSGRRGIVQIGDEIVLGQGRRRRALLEGGFAAQFDEPLDRTLDAAIEL